MYMHKLCADLRYITIIVTIIIVIIIIIIIIIIIVIIRYEGEPARQNTLRNQFNFSERASQTLTEVTRSRVGGRFKSATD